ncbi:MAG: 50S ribosomal protein L29 [Elusimicrobia bacterium]|nr:50S ribosomal protein L29 [Candidatus Liberimonas magnetica]
MKGKVWQEIKNLSDVELETKLRETEEELFRLRFRHSSTPLKNPLLLRYLKRTIAKIRTLFKERETVKASN